MRFLPEWLAQLIGDSRFDATVERIVGRIEGPLWKRIVGGDATMSAFEARGYIRARSMVLVADQIPREVSVRTPQKQRDRLKKAVLQRLMSKMIARLNDHAEQQHAHRQAA